ncbi:MAG: hypothetical protein ACEPOW_11190 [Bacteroidales bacterium]
MKVFLKIKHWQCVLLFLTIMLTIFTIGIFVGIKHYNNPGRIINLQMNIIFINIPIICINFLWYYSIFKYLHKESNIDYGINDYKYHLYFFLWIFSGLGGLFSIYYFYPNGTNNTLQSISFFPFSMHVLSPFTYFTWIFSIYIMYQTAKMIRSVELERDTNFKENIWTFICLFFVIPFGVFWIQPKLNRNYKKIVAKENH